jgi:hypothetical protein
VSAILRVNIVDLTVQPSFNFSAPPEANPDVEAGGLLAAQPAGPRKHDRFGKLRISRLREHFGHIRQVEQIAERRRFFHWELAFADIFRERGGFDLILGNPPWLKVEWEEAGILGERNPLFAIRKLSASEINTLRAQTFGEFPGMQSAWLVELEEAEATQAFLNGTQNYPLLRGIQTNLYKCFLPIGWRISRAVGVAGFLHPEGIYDDPKGGLFREASYSRLRLHFQFLNEKKLFPIGNRYKFGINVYAGPASRLRFRHVCNLYLPVTIYANYEHDGRGPVPGVKTVDDEWELKGHADRMLDVDDCTLSLFAKLYDEPGTQPRHARLPALHAGTLIGVLEKLARYPRRLGDLGDGYFSTVMFDETYVQRDGTIRRHTGFVAAASDWVLSGPHFFVANPFSQPRNGTAIRIGRTTSSTSKRFRTTICRGRTTGPWRTAPNTSAAPPASPGSTPATPPPARDELLSLCEPRDAEPIRRANLHHHGGSAWCRLGKHDDRARVRVLGRTPCVLLPFVIDHRGFSGEKHGHGPCE